MEEYEAEHCMWDWDEMPLDRKCVDGPVTKIVLHGSHWLNPGVTKKIDISDCADRPFPISIIILSLNEYLYSVGVSIE